MGDYDLGRRLFALLLSIFEEKFKNASIYSLDELAPQQLTSQIAKSLGTYSLSDLSIPFAAPSQGSRDPYHTHCFGIL